MMKRTALVLIRLPYLLSGSQCSGLIVSQHSVFLFHASPPHPPPRLSLTWLKSLSVLKNTRLLCLRLAFSAHALCSSLPANHITSFYSPSFSHPHRLYFLICTKCQMNSSTLSSHSLNNYFTESNFLFNSATEFWLNNYIVYVTLSQNNFIILFVCFREKISLIILGSFWFCVSVVYFINFFTVLRIKL